MAHEITLFEVHYDGTLFGSTRGDDSSAQTETKSDETAATESEMIETATMETEMSESEMMESETMEMESPADSSGSWARRILGLVGVAVAVAVVGRRVARRLRADAEIDVESSGIEIDEEASEMDASEESSGMAADEKASGMDVEQSSGIDADADSVESVAEQ